MMEEDSRQTLNFLLTLAALLVVEAIQNDLQAQVSAGLIMI